MRFISNALVRTWLFSAFCFCLNRKTPLQPALLKLVFREASMPSVVNASPLIFSPFSPHFFFLRDFGSFSMREENFLFRFIGAVVSLFEASRNLWRIWFCNICRWQFHNKPSVTQGEKFIGIFHSQFHSYSDKNLHFFRISIAKIHFWLNCVEKLLNSGQNRFQNNPSPQIFFHQPATFTTWRSQKPLRRTQGSDC